MAIRVETSTSNIYVHEKSVLSLFFFFTQIFRKDILAFLNKTQQHDL